MAKLKPELTAKQRDVLRFIVAYLSRHGKSPTFGEIAGEFGWASPNAVAVHLRALARKGHILQTPDKHRNITVLESCVCETIWGPVEIGV